MENRLPRHSKGLKGQMERMTFLVRVVIPAFIFSSCAVADLHLLGTESVAEQSGAMSSSEATTLTPDSSESIIEPGNAEPMPQEQTSIDAPNASSSSFSETAASPIDGTPASSSNPGQWWGEFVGVKTKWQEVKRKLIGEIQEQEWKTQELRVKLQLIEQMTQDVDFTTKAYVQEEQALMVEWFINNRTPYSLKDISVTCDQIAPSGTTIQSHNETLYEIIPPQEQRTFKDIQLGKKDRQAQSLECQITNFTVHNS